MVVQGWIDLRRNGVGGTSKKKKIKKEKKKTQKGINFFGEWASIL